MFREKAGFVAGRIVTVPGDAAGQSGPSCRCQSHLMLRWRSYVEDSQYNETVVSAFLALQTKFSFWQHIFRLCRVCRKLLFSPGSGAVNRVA